MLLRFGMLSLSVFTGCGDIELEVASNTINIGSETKENEGMADIPSDLQDKLDAVAFRQLLSHLDDHKEVQNING